MLPHIWGFLTYWLHCRNLQHVIFLFGVFLAKSPLQWLSILWIINYTWTWLVAMRHREISSRCQKCYSLYLVGLPEGNPLDLKYCSMWWTCNAMTEESNENYWKHFLVTHCTGFLQFLPQKWYGWKCYLVNFTIQWKLHYKPAAVEVMLLWNITASLTTSLLIKNRSPNTKIHLSTSTASYLAVLPSHSFLPNKKRRVTKLITPMDQKIKARNWLWPSCISNYICFYSGYFCAINAIPQVRAVLCTPSTASSGCRNLHLQSWIRRQSDNMQSTHISVHGCSHGQFPDSGRAGCQLGKFAGAGHFPFHSKKENDSGIKD